jgi:hypothetical protein
MNYTDRDRDAQHKVKLNENSYVLWLGNMQSDLDSPHGRRRLPREHQSRMQEQVVSEINELVRRHDIN